MKDCFSDQTLRQFADGILSETVAEEVCAHLEACAACGRTLDEFFGASALKEWQQAADLDADFEMSPSLAAVRRRLLLLSDTDQQLAAGTPSKGDRHGQMPIMPAMVGRFHLRQMLGSGGFGVVYAADDPVLKRKIALKLPCSGTIVDPELRQRFLREGEAAASLHHPNIVPVLEAGEADGFCYLAMAHCSGRTLTEWLRAHSDPVGAHVAARILLLLAEAVEHAHSGGVLHRDIKPSNVLLDETHPMAGLPFTPLLADFGMAKVLAADSRDTQSGVIMGTPRYMAPEQALGNRSEVGPKADIYALGVVLYEVLTGETPFGGDDNADTLRRIVAEEPKPPRRLAPYLPRDLEAICLRCLEKPIDRRYDSASDLADDLRRFLAGQPTRARPVTPPERLARWTRRNPLLAALAATIMLAGALAIAGLAFHTRRIEQANQDLDGLNTRLSESLRSVEESRQKTADLLYASEMRFAARARQNRDDVLLSQILDRYVPQPGEPDRRGFEWHYLRHAGEVDYTEFPSHQGRAYTVSWSPDGKWIASGGEDGNVHLCPADDPADVRTIETGQGEVNQVTFSPDCLTLASAGDDGTVRLWDRATGKMLRSIPAHHRHAYGVAFTPDGKLLVSCANEPDIRLWDAATGETLGILTGHSNSVEAIAISPDGRWLASAGGDNTARIWDIPRRTLVRTDERHSKILSSVAFSPDSRWIATGSHDKTFSVWDRETGRTLIQSRRAEGIQSVAFAADGSWIAAGETKGRISLWRTDSLNSDRPNIEPHYSWHAIQPGLYSLQFSPAGDEIVIAGDDGRVLACRGWERPAVRTLDTRQVVLWDMAYLPKSTRLVTVGDTGVRIWETTAGQEEAVLAADRAPWRSVAVSQDGQLLAAGNRSAEVSVWNLPERKLIRTYPIDGVRKHVVRVALSADARTAAVVLAPGRETGLKAWDLVFLDLTTGQIARPLREEFITVCMFSPDGRTIAVGVRSDGSVRILDAATQAERFKLPIGTDSHDLRFSADGRLLATNFEERRIRIWEVDTGAEVTTLTGHLASIMSFAFAPDGRTLVSAGVDGRCKLWHLSSGMPLFDLVQHPVGLDHVHFTSDGQQLACTQSDGVVLLFDAPRPRAGP